MTTYQDLIVNSLWIDSTFKSRKPYIAKIISVSDHTITFTLPNSPRPTTTFTDTKYHFIRRWKPFKDTSVSEYIL